MRRFVYLFALFALLVGSVGPALAQTGGWDRKFVTTRDGTVYVVMGPLRHRVQAVLIGNDELNQLQDGEAVATVDDLLRVASAGGGMASGAQAPAPPAASAPPTPAHTLLGRQFRICYQGYQPGLVEPLEVGWSKTIDGKTATGMWVFLLANVTFNGTLLQSEFTIRDERGRTWGATGLGTEMTNQYGAKSFSASVQGTERLIMAFDVAPDVKSLEILSAPTPCS